jgi:hypothetical protein
MERNRRMFEDRKLSIEIHMNHIRVCLVFIVVAVIGCKQTSSVI